jgi:hypothetical protein
MHVQSDRELKNNLFNYYQHELTERKLRKEDDITKEKLADKLYIEQIIKNNEEDRIKKEMERANRVNAGMYDYGQALMRKEEEKRKKFGRVEENIINNMNNNNNINSNQHINNLNNNNNNYIYGSHPNIYKKDLNPKYTNPNKVDHLNYIMHPDKNMGLKQIDEIERNRKFELQKYYKDILDSQMNHPAINGNKKKGYDYTKGNMISNPCN